MKNKIQSYVGMRLGGCRLIDTLTTHLSPTNHPLKHGIGKYIFSFLLVLAMSIGQMWAAEVTVGFTTATGASSGTEATRSIVSEDHLTVTHIINSGTAGALSEYSSSNKGVYYGSSTAIYTKGGYKWNKNTGTTFNNNYVGFQVDVEDGYKLSLSELELTLAVSAGFTCKVEITDGTNNLYSSDSWAIANNGKNGTNGINPTFTAVGNPDLQDLTGTFYVRVQLAFNSTGKYLCCPIFTITGDLEEVGGGGEDPVCPSGISITGEDEYTEGETISLTATKTAGNGEITYTWYRGADLATAKAAGALGTGATYTKSNCVTGDAGKYFCEATKTSCSAAASTGFDVSVDANPVCFNMPAITSQPSDLAHITVTGGTLADVGVGKTLKMQSTGIGFGNGNAARLQVSLTSASIVEGTKITIYYNNASSDGSGIGLYNENYEHQVINETGVTGSGNFSHTFTAEEAANYADVFLIDRNNTGKGIIVGSITVEDCGPAIVKHTVTLNYNDGETPAGSLTVVDGNAAVKPADPTRGKYTFLGWFVGDTDDEYVWSTAVTGDITLKAHWQDPWTISFDAGEGSAVADITVKHNTLAEKPADPTWAGHDFNGWTEGGSPFDWTAAITADHALVADWIAEVAKYDVEYYDGETKIGTEEQVRADQHPTAAGIEISKPLYSFVGWFTSSSLVGDPVDLSTVTPVEGLKLYGKWNKVYATSYDMEAYAVSDGATLETLLSNLDAAGYAYTNVNGIDYGHTHNYIYDGMKYKTNDGDLSFNVNAGKLVIVKTGNLPANALTMYINGVADPTEFVGANEAVETHVNNYFYSEAEALYRLDIQASKGTCAIKAVTITNPFQVSFDPNEGDPVAAQYGYPSVTLPLPIKGTESFIGWFDGETKVGEAGEQYTPTANITLVAHWEAVSTDARLASISFSSDAGTLEPIFDPEVTSYTYTMPYGTAAVPTITGATSVNANAQEPEIASQAAAWNETAVIRGVAQSGDKKTYNVTMKIEPKDGISIIKVATTGGTNKTVTGLYAGDGDVNLSSNTKMDGGKYIGFILDGTTLQAGDRINVHTTQASSSGGSHIIFYDNMSDKNELYDTEEIGGTGDNIFTINASMVGATTAYVYRSDADNPHKWNGYVDYIEVTRAMNPVLTAIAINGRDGEIDALDDHHFNVTIPYEADLANLTIVPTIVRNAAHATTPEAVISNEGAWIIGDNTYRVMDKDGDYTDYTITLDRDVLKHTVSFNTHGGSAVASVEVEHNGYLAAAPTAPTKEDYLFQYWSLSDGGAEVDVTTVQITENKEFHAVWAPDGAIKLLNGATVNHTNYITGVTADETVEFKGNEVHYAKFSGTVSGVNGVKDLTRVIAYNATTNKTKIQISAHNNSTSGRSILVKGLVEGASAATDLATIALGNKEDKVSEWIEFNNAANRTIYIMVSSSAGDVYFTQVKVIESGETPMKQAGEAGYSLNLNKGRFFGLANTDLAFEGLNARLSGDYTALNSDYAKLNATSMSFTVASDMNLVVTTNNSKTYYVTKGAAGTDNETAKTGVSEFELTAGTWYITAGSSEVQFTNIAFALPKCEQPTVVDMESIGLCEGDAFITLTVSASVSDEGTLHYAWFKEAGATDEAVGTDAASFTPEADGEYYVIVTNQKTGYSDNSETSNTVSVEHFGSAVITTAPANVAKEVGQEATLSVVASGKNCTYQWFTCDDALGTNPVAIVPAETEASLTVTVAAGEQYYMVVVSSDCGAPVSAVAKVAQWRELAPANVTGSMTWDWTSAAWNGITGDIAFANTGVEELMANVNAKVPCVDGANGFRSDMLYGTGQYVWRSSNKFFQGTKIRFITTVPGKLVVRYRNTSGSTNTRTIKITNNGEVLPADGTNTTNSFKNTNPMVVKAGEVIIEGIASEENGLTRIEKIIFDADLDPTQAEDATLGGYERNVTEGRYGTICLPKAGIMVGAAIFELAYYSESDNKIFMDQVMSGEMVAGRPYVFLPNEGVSTLGVYYTDDEAVAAGDYRGLYGYYDGTDNAMQLDPGDGHYILYNNQFREVTVSHVWIDQNRAYFKIGVAGGIPTNVVAPLPGRRRMSIGAAAPQVTTGMDELNAGEAPVKVLINGELFILRGDKMFDATGRLIK